MFIVVRVITRTAIRHFYLIRFVVKNVVVDAIDFEIVRPKGGSCHEGKKERKNLFHDMIFYGYSFVKPLRCKGTTKNAHTQEKRVIILKMIDIYQKCAFICD